MKKVLFLILGLLAFFPQSASAQSQRNPCVYLTTSNQNCVPVGSSVTGVGNSPMPVGGLANASAPTYVEGQTGSLSFDLTGNLRTTGGGGGSTTVPGFTPGGTFATLTATGSSASVALPAGATVAFQNTGTTTVSCTLGIGSATATANQIIVQAASTVFLVPGTNTFGACIDTTGSASNLVVLAGGSGLGTGFGGGGGASTGNTSVQSAVNVTLTDCSSTIATGGTAQNAFTAAATRHGFIIANIDTAEVMWINFTGTAVASGTGSYPLAPASTVTFSGLNSFASPIGMGINTALSVIAVTTAHKFSCTVW
jgi:flagellin-like hook-associated protein FlgL